MLTHLAFVGGRVTVALAALNVGASAFTVGVLASLFAVVPMFLAVSMGRLVDRIGVRGPMTVGAAGMAAGWALAFFLPQGFLGPIIAGFAIDGLGHWNAFLLLAAFPAVALTALAVARVALPGPRPRSAAPAGRNVFELLADPGLRKVLVVSAISNMTWDLFVFLVRYSLPGSAANASIQATGSSPRSASSRAWRPR